MFNFLNKKDNSANEIPELDPSEQAVIVQSVFESGEDLGTEDERKNIENLEIDINNTLSDHTELDGHEVGDGTFTLYLYGLDADEIFNEIKQPLRISEFIWYDITLRYGPAQDSNAKVKSFKFNSKQA